MTGADADLHRVAAILISKEAGFGLADIRTMLAARSAPARLAVTVRHRETLIAGRRPYSTCSRANAPTTTS